MREREELERVEAREIPNDLWLLYVTRTSSAIEFDYMFAATASAPPAAVNHRGQLINYRVESCVHVCVCWGFGEMANLSAQHNL